MNLATALTAHGPIEPIGVKEAREKWWAFRQECGWVTPAPILTPPTGNHKLMKSSWPTYAVSLSPANYSGHNVCPNSTPMCRKGCIAFAGKGELPKILQARIDKTRFLAQYPEAFLTLVADEIGRNYSKHGRMAVRLNNFSDIAWESVAPWLFDQPSWKRVQFYDYTKRWEREGLDNYHLTYSASERTSEEDVARACAEYRNVAVVFATARSQALPETYAGVLVVDGDKTDERFLDPKGFVVGLRAKGRMRKPAFRGFVREV